MYAWCGHVGESQTIFNNLEKKNIYTWNNMLSAYARNGHMQDTQVFFDNMLVRDCVSWNTLHTAYARGGDTSGSCIVFESIPERSIVAYTTMLKVLGEDGYTDHSTDLFWEMPERDVISWNALSTAYARKGHPVQGISLLLKTPQCSVSSWNLMLSMYFHLGELTYAESLFEVMQERDSLTWTVMIQGYAQEGHMELCESLLDRMPEHTHSVWNFVIQVHASSGRLHHAKKLFESMRFTDIASWTLMVTAYGQADDHERAKMAFERMHAHDVVSWNALLQAYARNSRIDETKKLFDEMPMKSFASWSTLVHAFSERGGSHAVKAFTRMPQWDSSVWNTVVRSLVADDKEDEAWEMFAGMPRKDEVAWTSFLSAHTQKGELETARELFEKMPWRDEVSWGCMIAGNSQNGYPDRALQLFVEMDMEGIRHDKSSFVCVLETSSAFQGRLIHEELSLSGFHSDVTVVTALVNMYGRHGLLRDAEKLFNNAIHTCGDPHLWNTMISAYSRNGEPLRAVEILMEMQLGGVKPTRVTFLSVFHGCSHAGVSLQLFISMQADYGIRPGVDHYTCLVDMLGRSGRLSESKEVLASMPYKPCLETLMAFLAGCKMQHKENEHITYGTSEVLELSDPRSSAALVVFSNAVYPEHARRLMECRGLRTRASFSTLYIRGRAMRFTVRDMKQLLQTPQKVLVYDTLQEISRRMKVAGYQFSVYDFVDDTKLLYHSELLAVAYGVAFSTESSAIRVVQNLRICVDCHTVVKFISSQNAGRVIVIRDANRFHHFSEGVCSCGDYW